MGNFWPLVASESMVKKVLRLCAGTILVIAFIITSWALVTLNVHKVEKLAYIHLLEQYNATVSTRQ